MIHTKSEGSEGNLNQLFIEPLPPEAKETCILWDSSDFYCNFA